MLSDNSPVMRFCQKQAREVSWAVDCQLLVLNKACPLHMGVRGPQTKHLDIFYLMFTFRGLPRPRRLAMMSFSSAIRKSPCSVRSCTCAAQPSRASHDAAGSCRSAVPDPLCWDASWALACWQTRRAPCAWHERATQCSAVLYVCSTT